MSTKILWMCETSNFVPVDYLFDVYCCLYVSSVVKPYSKWKPKNREPKKSEVFKGFTIQVTTVLIIVHVLSGRPARGQARPKEVPGMILQ